MRLVVERDEERASRGVATARRKPAAAAAVFRHSTVQGLADHLAARLGPRVTIDLKWRKQVDPSGLELWVPVFASHFPLAARFMPRIFEAWGIPVPPIQRPAYTLEQFLGEIVDPDPDLAAVELTKRREAFVLDGTRCELATIRAGEVPMESFRLEHEDPALLMQVLRRLGLDSRRNINYPMGLKAALGLLAA